MLLFLIYTTPLYKAIKEWGGNPSGFIDDITITVQGEIHQNSKRLSTILKKCKEWTASRVTKIDMSDKLQFIHFTKSYNKKVQQSKLTLPNGEKRDPQQDVKLLGIVLDHALNFKKHIHGKIASARKAVGAIWRLGGTKLGMRGSAVRSLYTACVRPIFEYGVEIWHHKVLKEQINKLDVMQNMALRRVLGAFKTTLIQALQKEAGILPYKHRLDYMAARKAARLYFSLNDTNPVTQHLKTLIPASPIGELTLMCNDIDCVARKIEELNGTVEPDTKCDPRLQQKMAIISLRAKAVKQWNRDYTFGNKGRWYRYLTIATECVDQMNHLVTNKILKYYNRWIISRITQLRTNHGYFGAWYQRMGIEKDSYNCRCGDLETVRHILVDCPLLELQRQGLERVSPEMDLPTLLNSVTGLQEIANFITTIRD